MDERVLDVLPQTWWEKIIGKLTVVYIDTEDRFLDREFNNYKVRAQFFSKTDSRYHLRVLRISKGLLDTFKTATFAARNKALVCGYREYDAIFNITKALIDGK